MDKRINTGNLEKGKVQVNRKKTIEIVLAVFVLCNVVKYIEFLIIKTDRTIISENIFCKPFIIAVLFFALSKLKWNWNKIGFSKKDLLKNAVLGLCLGVSTFFLSYLTEYLVLAAMGKKPRIAFFITNFALSNQKIRGTSFAMVVMVTHDIFDSYLDGFTQIYYLANGETLEAGFYDDLMNKKGDFYNIKEAMSKNNTSAS